MNNVANNNMYFDEYKDNFQQNPSSSHNNAQKYYLLIFNKYP